MSAEKDSGNLGEQIAADFLVRRGYTILERQWRFGHGEVDLIARRGDHVAFVEVKTRSGSGYGGPEAAITASKARRLARLAEAYRTVKGVAHLPFSVDVVAVETSGEPGTALVRHHENVLAELPFVDNRRGMW